MSYRALLVALALGTGEPTFSARLAAADPTLPPGAALRLGDTRFRAGGPVSDLVFSADGSELTARVPLDDATTRVTTWDAATGLPVSTATEPRRPGTRVRWTATIIPDSPRGVVIDDGVPVVRDFDEKKDLARLTGHFARATAVAVSADGRRIATASADGLVRVWDARTYRPLVEPHGHTAAVRTLEVSPDGRTVLTVGADRTARVWDIATGRELKAFPIADDIHPTFSGDGSAVLIPAGDRVVARDLVTGLEITSAVRGGMPDPLAPLTVLGQYLGVCVAISPDGRAVAVGGRDGTVELFEVASGQVRRRLVGHGGPCLDVAFTLDGSRLLSAGADHAVLAWPVRVRDVPLTAGLKRETSAARLWDRLMLSPADEAYRAMARLAADPAAAVKMARLRLKPGAEVSPVADARVVELLEAVGTAEARAFLRELADDAAGGGLVREARSALTRLGDVRYSRDGVRTVGGTRP
jgi:hypothetical protein